MAQLVEDILVEIICVSSSRPRRQHTRQPLPWHASPRSPRSPSSPAMPKPNPRAASSSAAAATSSPDAVRKEREENTVPAVYDASADIEDDYRLFLENVLVYENEDFVLEYEGKVVRYGGDEAVSAGGGSRGEDPVMEKEKEKEKEVDVVVISSSSDDESTKIVSEPNPLDRGVFQRKVNTSFHFTNLFFFLWLVLLRF